MELGLGGSADGSINVCPLHSRLDVTTKNLGQNEFKGAQAQHRCSTRTLHVYTFALKRARAAHTQSIDESVNLGHSDYVDIDVVEKIMSRMEGIQNREEHNHCID